MENKILFTDKDLENLEKQREKMNIERNRNQIQVGAHGRNQVTEVEMVASKNFKQESNKHNQWIDAK